MPQTRRVGDSYRCPDAAQREKFYEAIAHTGAGPRLTRPRVRPDGEFPYLRAVAQAPCVPPGSASSPKLLARDNAQFALDLDATLKLSDGGETHRLLGEVMGNEWGQLRGVLEAAIRAMRGTVKAMLPPDARPLQLRCLVSSSTGPSWELVRDEDRAVMDAMASYSGRENVSTPHAAARRVIDALQRPHETMRISGGKVSFHLRFPGLFLGSDDAKAVSRAVSEAVAAHLRDVVRAGTANALERLVEAATRASPFVDFKAQNVRQALRAIGCVKVTTLCYLDPSGRRVERHVLEHSHRVNLPVGYLHVAADGSVKDEPLPADADMVHVLTLAGRDGNRWLTGAEWPGDDPCRVLVPETGQPRAPREPRRAVVPAAPAPAGAAPRERVAPSVCQHLQRYLNRADDGSDDAVVALEVAFLKQLDAVVRRLPDAFADDYALWSATLRVLFSAFTASDRIDRPFAQRVFEAFSKRSAKWARIDALRTPDGSTGHSAPVVYNGRFSSLSLLTRLVHQHAGAGDLGLYRAVLRLKLAYRAYADTTVPDATRAELDGLGITLAPDATLADELPMLSHADTRYLPGPGATLDGLITARPDRNVLCVRANTGTGKTQALLESAARLGLRTLVVAPFKSLCADIAARWAAILREAGSSERAYAHAELVPAHSSGLYSEPGRRGAPRFAVTTPESAWRFVGGSKRPPYELVIVDEANAVLASVRRSTFLRFDVAWRVAGLRKVLEGCRHLVLADAHLTRVTTDAFREASGVAEPAACHTLHYNAVTSFYLARVHVLHEGQRSADAVAGLVAHALARRRRQQQQPGGAAGTVVVGVHYGERRIQELVHRIRGAAGAGTTVAYVCGNSSDEDKERYGPGGDWTDVDVFVYNPVYGCGVDLSHAEAFAAVFHLALGVLGACTADQLTRRVRATAGRAIDIVFDEAAGCVPAEPVDTAKVKARDERWAARVWEAAAAQHRMERVRSRVDFLAAVARSGGLLTWAVHGGGGGDGAAHERLARIAHAEGRHRVAADAHLLGAGLKEITGKVARRWRECIGDGAARAVSERLYGGKWRAGKRKGAADARPAKRARHL
jgi:DEAD/DEAH box helicase